MVIRMKKYINDYIEVLNSKLDNKITEKDINELLNKIRFFSHERFIHLIITLFFALLSLIFIYLTLTFKIFSLLIVTIILLIMLVFYIFHYYFLENTILNLYKMYDKFNENK